MRRAATITTGRACRTANSAGIGVTVALDLKSFSLVEMRKLYKSYLDRDVSFRKVIYIRVTESRGGEF